MRQYIKVVKIAVGSTTAIMIAYFLGLDYAVSAGIITLLTLQDTKKETIFIAIKRIAAFVLSVIIVLIVFSVLSYTPIAYGVFLLIFSGICYAFKMYDAIPMNAVLASHYLLEKDMSAAMIGNESLLLLIGAGIGILLNLYIPNNVRQIRAKQRIIEADLKSILSQMADKLLIGDKSDYNDSSLLLLIEHISIGLQQAYTNMNNTFFQETRYYIEYMQMRKQQSEVLKEIYDKIVTITAVSSQSQEVADFIRSISKTLSETQNAKGLLLMEDTLLLKFKESPLPVTRDEFEHRAVLYNILMDFRIFLKMKEEFVDSITEEQKERYWKSNE